MNNFKSQYEDDYNKLIDVLTDEISKPPSKNEPCFNNEETPVQSVDFDNNDYDYIQEVTR